MIVIIKEEKNSIYKKNMKTFKRKGISYYLFIFSLKLYNIKYEVMEDDTKFNKRIRKRKKTKQKNR